MAALTATHPTLLDVAQTLDPNGGIAEVAEVLTETNPILLDLPFFEGNMPDGHKTSVRTGLPGVTWRKLYGGVQPSKSTVASVRDTSGMLEAYAEIDKALADLNGNSAAWRKQEERPFIEAMNQEMADTLFYGNEGSEPEAFTGLSPRFNLSTAINGENVIKADGAGTDNTSIWLCVWGQTTGHGFYPKGSKAGLSIEDKGQVTIESVDGNGGRMEAYRTHYRWDMGLVVRDWRYFVRVCNIDRSALVKDAASGSDLPDLMFRAMTQIPNLGMGKPVFYMSRNTLSFLRRQLERATRSSTLQSRNVGGIWTESFQDIPIRRCDALAADEALVS